MNNTSLDIAIAAMRAGESSLDVDIIALEALRAGRVRDKGAQERSDPPFYSMDQDSDDGSPVVPIIDASKTERTVFCVALVPNVPDTYGSVMLPDSIAYTAHRYMAMSRVVKAEHATEIKAMPVESYVAPQDLIYDSGMYGPQRVTKGSWVVGIKVFDDAIWQGIVQGDYTGISVGGYSMQGDLPT